MWTNENYRCRNYLKSMYIVLTVSYAGFSFVDIIQRVSMCWKYIRNDGKLILLSVCTVA